ncbi:MAG: polysaccharide deacetylase family protein [bacterium]
MYHTIGRPNPRWLWSHLTCSPEILADQIATLGARGYHAATLDDVDESVKTGRLPRRKCVVLTFDDGYLDNWVYAYPMLKKAGWKGIVYVNPDFVDPGETPRPNLEDVWAGRCAETDLPLHGFLNWAELEIMDRSGVLQVGCHSMTHTWYPSGPSIADFHRPGLDTPWLAWNADPARKPFYLTEDQSGIMPWGTPIHENGRSLGIRRWFPDPDQEAATVAHVQRHGGADFFTREGWKDELLGVAREADQGRGRAETDDELDERYRHEITGARRALAMRLGRSIDHFCWPGGAYNDASWAVAEAEEFRTMTVKRHDLTRLEAPGTTRVRRISDHHHYMFLGRIRKAPGADLLADACDREWGQRRARAAMLVRKAIWALRANPSR